MTGTAPLLLDVRGVSKIFGGFTAVNEVDLKVSSGEILGIAGPNGAGKSTLFNLISKLPFGPSSGTVFFCGERIDDIRPHRIARLGLRRTFQAEQLFSSLSVYDNVHVSATYLRVPRNQRTAETRRALNRVALESSSSEPAGELPLLDKKKLMIASALVGNPRLLLLDEPAGGLNVDDQAELIDLLRSLHEEGLALIIIEHVLSLLKALAGRMIVMSSGEVLTVGSPDEVLSNPLVLEAYLGKRAAA